MSRQEKFMPPALLHGGDYNPEQWLDCPEILKEDIRLMKLAHVNTVSLGIFSWAFLEPEEGVYRLDYMEEIIGRLYENGICILLATPSGGMPCWLTEAYPQVLQTDEYGVQNLPGKRHNFCYTSPVMREKTRQINQRLAERFSSHPAVKLWHISNEYGGNFRDASCHCPQCQQAFRLWLKEKYKSLDALNRAWYTSFWSHTITGWEQIHSPSPRGEDGLHGLNLDWRRFVSFQLEDFSREEIKTVRRYSRLPVTVNMMRYFEPLDYDKWSRAVDVISWDSYPDWHTMEDEVPVAVWAAFMHNQMRSFHKEPFLLMESTPSLVNWKEQNNVKRPGMHYLSSMQAVAHGSNSVLYFQWRKSRGSFEKFHGAVVDHDGSEDNRVFAEVQKVGEDLEKISSQVLDTCNQSRAAIVMDWENWWAMKDAAGADKSLDYVEELLHYYRPLWELGIETDVISMDRELEDYQLVIAPVLYLYKEDYISRVQEFVKKGGTYLATYWSGRVDETDLCFLGKRPLEELLGLSVKEIDVGNPYMPNTVIYHDIEYPAGALRELVRLTTARSLACYGQDYNAGTPAAAVNDWGRGRAYYLAAQTSMEFLREFYGEILKAAEVKPNLPDALPYGVTVSRRSGQQDIYFLQNFNRKPVDMRLGGKYRNLVTGEPVEGEITLEQYQCLVLTEEK